MLEKITLLSTVLGLTFNCGNGVEIKDFFPDVSTNLTKVRWAHAVNNQAHLNTALRGDVMMLECDVTYGKINDTGPMLPITAHPPSTSSDLSLENLLLTVIKFNKNNQVNRKGVKLDFKSEKVFSQSLPILQKMYNEIDFPVLLNADIIRGPLIPTIVKPIDSNNFIKQSKQFRKFGLSLGWTTFIVLPVVMRYTSDNFQTMLKTIEQYDLGSETTLAVRAALLQNSNFDDINALKTKSNVTITIWTNKIDFVDISKLRKVIFDFGLDRTYIDMPKHLFDQLDLS